MDAIFNSLETYLKFLYCIFPLKIKQRKQSNITNPWTTPGIKVHVVTEESCTYPAERVVIRTQ